MNNKISKRNMTSNLLKPDSAKKNFAFQFLYQMVILVVPLVVSPYLTRTLGGTSLGIYSYTYSIAYYFVVFAMLGINKYGQRIISQRRGNVVELRTTFWSLYFVHFVASVLALLTYVLYVFVICESDVNIALVQLIYVASATFDLTWLFYGLEKFKMVTVRNVVVKLLETGCIFLLVKQPSDIVIYTLIMTASTILGHLIMVPQVLRALPPIRFCKADVVEHFKPLLTLFVAAVAVSLYTVFDKTLLGLMLNKESVAYYEYSNKIIKIPETFITIISTVLYPKACQYAQNDDFKGMKSNMEKSVTVTCLIGFAACFGLLSVAEQFALLYYGDEFAVCGEIISMMCPLILILGIGETVRLQYIYPLKMDMTMVKVVSLNAIVNLALSAALIPSLGIDGAVIGTIAAEMTGFLIEIFLVRKYVSVKWFLFECLPCALIGLVMYFVVKGVGAISGSGWLSLGIQVIIGGVVYCICVLAYMYFFKRELLNIGIREIKKKLKFKH